MRFSSLVYLLFALLLFSAFELFASETVDPKPRIVFLAEHYVGTVETTPNSGPVIDSMLAVVGLQPGSPWCAADVSFLLLKTGAAFPKPSTTALGFRDRRHSVSATDVYTGFKKVPPGWIHIMQRGHTWQGHCGIVSGFIDRTTYRCIDGNTSPQPGTVVAERDGDGHWPRIRKVEPWNYFSVKWFTPVFYRSEKPDFKAG